MGRAGGECERRRRAAWNTVRDGRPQILFAWSGNRGKTWCEARPLPGATGGDQFQPALATDATGAFHPFWADSRTGTFQVYTAVVKVEEPATQRQ